jgi:hypothetical protein
MPRSGDAAPSADAPATSLCVARADEGVVAATDAAGMTTAAGCGLFTITSQSHGDGDGAVSTGVAEGLVGGGAEGGMKMSVDAVAMACMNPAYRPGFSGSKVPLDPARTHGLDNTLAQLQENSTNDGSDVVRLCQTASLRRRCTNGASMGQAARVCKSHKCDHDSTPAAPLAGTGMRVAADALVATFSSLDTTMPTPLTWSTGTASMRKSLRHAVATSAADEVKEGSVRDRETLSTMPWPRNFLGSGAPSLRLYTHVKQWSRVLVLY